MGSEDIIIFLASAILGVIGAPTLFQWLKKLLQLEDRWALVLVYVASFAVAGLGLFVSGEYAEFNLENFFQAAATIIASAQFAYKMLNPK